MSRPLRRLLFALAVMALLAGGIWYYSRPDPAAVILRPVERGRVEATAANTRAGTVNACRRARLSPATGGQVARLRVREGQHVQAGEVLLQLWNEDLAAELERSRSEALAAQARAAEACFHAEVSEREAERLVQLRAKKLVAEEQVDQAVTQAKARRAACEAAQVGVQARRDAVAVAQAALARTTLRAPFAGIIAEINPELGEFITPSPTGIPTPPAVDLIDYSCLYVTAPIDEVDAPAIRPGMPARIALDAFPARRFAGRVRRVAPYVLDRERQARTVDVEVDFVHPERAQELLPGYSADVEVILEARDDTLRIPTEAVLEGKHVLVYRPDDGVLEQRRIETGLSNWEHTEVRAGLAAGEQVVVSAEREGVAPGASVVPEATGSGRGAP